MKHSLKNWKLAYSFTCKQYMGNARFKIVTALIGVLLVGVLAAVILITAMPEEEDEEAQEGRIERLCLMNETELSLDALPELFSSEEELADVALETVGTRPVEELIAYAAEQSERTCAGVLKREEDRLVLSVFIPDGSSVEEDSVEELETALTDCIYAAVLLNADIQPAQVVLLQMPVMSSSIEAGEQTSLAATLIKYLAPMMFGLFMYFIVLLYGQSVSKEVSVEKTSKLMETLLTSIHPYALVTGKVLAIFSTAMLQCFIWIGCILVGVFGSSFAAAKLFPDGGSTVTQAVNFLREELGSTALSVPSVILAIVVFSAGCLLFFALAGVAGSIVSKPEDTASAQAVFIYPVLIGWLVPYFALLAENETVLRVCRVVPFTAPFCVPAELLTGTVGWGIGVLSTVLLLLASAALVWLTARIYRGLVLYTGQKISWKTLTGVIRGK
ncbi:MAG: ABC transporter permease [Lachnospiraceae bacterium]|nr:ABC transporter permease [Lachnospiraceae bacterium]